MGQDDALNARHHCANGTAFSIENLSLEKNIYYNGEGVYVKENIFLDIALCLIIGYALGCISPSFLVGKFKGYDVRRAGSHNAGATNTMLMAGKVMGILVALTDMLKASCSWWFCTALFPDMELAGILGGVACIIGHMYPIFLGFKGGKGLACMGGVILAYNIKAFMLMLAIAILIGIITNYVCIVTSSMAAVWPLYYGSVTRNWLGAVVLLIPFVPIVYKHAENFRRIPEGKELRLSYLWNKEAELLRTGYEETKR